MAFSFNEETYAIRMPPGDTGDLWIEVEWGAMSEGDAVLFAIVDKRSSEDLMCRAAEVRMETDESGVQIAKAHIRLCNHDTRDLEPGTHYWQLRLVTSPARDADGNVIADECSDHVVSVFDEMPVFKLLRKGARV